MHRSPTLRHPRPTSLSTPSVVVVSTILRIVIVAVVGVIVAIVVVVVVVVAMLVILGQSNCHLVDEYHRQLEVLRHGIQFVG